MGRHEAEAMGRQTDLVLDASLPKHKNQNNGDHSNLFSLVPLVMVPKQFY